MSYAQLSDVQALNPKRVYGASTTPSTAQVQGYIDQIAAEIDSVLSARQITVPVTTPAAFLTFLTGLNARGAGALAEQAMFPDVRGGQSVTGQAGSLWKQYQDGLTWLKTANLPGGSPSTVLPFSFLESNKGSDIEPGQDDPGWSKARIGIHKEF